MADLSKDVLAFSKAFARMCKAQHDCTRCPAEKLEGCGIEAITPELIAVVKRWNDEHPLKTYAQDYRERNPYAMFWEDGCYPVQVCRAYAYRNISLRSDCDGRCRRCWNEPMEEK